MQADAKAKRGGIAPAQVVGETEQAWSCGHDESAYCCIETDEDDEDDEDDEPAVIGEPDPDE